MARHQPFQIFGYHSCDKKVGMKVLTGAMDLRQSNNPCVNNPFMITGYFLPRPLAEFNPYLNRDYPVNQ